MHVIFHESIKGKWFVLSVKKFYTVKTCEDRMNYIGHDCIFQLKNISLSNFIALSAAVIYDIAPSKICDTEINLV